MTMQTTEQQERAAAAAAAERDEVAGYDGSLVNLGPITVAPQINTNLGLNLAVANFAPVTQVLGQTGVNGLGIR
jgi:hypothetical protein